MNYSFDILTLQSPSPKTQNSDHLNIIHTKKTHREKRKSIPDSCYHLHLLHLLRQDSFLSFLPKLLSFCFVSFSFRSFVFSTLFCFVCLCLTKPVKLSNSTLYASTTRPSSVNFVHLHYLFYHLYYFLFSIDCLFYYLYYFILSIDCLFY